MDSISLGISQATLLLLTIRNNLMVDLLLTLILIVTRILLAKQLIRAIEVIIIIPQGQIKTAKTIKGRIIPPLAGVPKVRCPIVKERSSKKKKEIG